MSSFWIVFFAQITIISIVIGLWTKKSGPSNILAGGIMSFIAAGFIIFNYGDLAPEDKNHWLLTPVRFVAPTGQTKAATVSNRTEKQVSFKDAYGVAQRTFETKRLEFAQQYAAAPNEIKKSAVWNAANQWTINYSKQEGLTATRWIGRVAKIATNQGGDWAEIELVSNYEGMNITYHATGLKSGTLVYNKVAELSSGDIVEFDAGFSESSTKGFSEGSWTERGSLEQPVFVVSLTDIKKWMAKPNS
ncbi:hypothetical protein [Microvirga alba]|uniref:Uncharacterized protein n=1 Tax=Microvirga alba TaxID=2791025 RepID=A0A931BTV5_9HYPH|nr:hypothetical protein [Microvirga alba]MBF9234618.1 hypothetical protein [Microvirga alba]